jgi:hypothetical protein
MGVRVDLGVSGVANKSWIWIEVPVVRGVHDG